MDRGPRNWVTQKREVPSTVGFSKQLTRGKLMVLGWNAMENWEVQFKKKQT